VVTVIIKTIGPTGRDYTTFALAEADTSNIGTSADLVANDEAIVFEADDTTFTTASTLNIANTALTVDATRNVSYTAASGRPVYEYTGTGTGVAFFDPYTRWSGIDVLASSGSAATQVRANSGYGAAQAGTVIENATITASVSAVSCEKFATGHALGTSSEPITLRNLVTKSIVAVSQFISGTGHTTGAHCLVVNCTHLGGSSPNQVWNWALTGGMPDASFKIINCANLAQNTSNDANITGGGVDISGSTNNIGNAAGSNSSFHFANIGGGIGAQYTPTTSFSTPLGSGDYAVYMGSNGSLANVTGNDVWQQGVGPGTNSDVPTTDINGVARSGATCNPGAFEADGFVAPTVTTQTIGPVGRDYATFTLAEASLPAEDITFTNRAFVFEADAATYSESVTFDSSLTTDATRNVTYKAAAGSEHGGVPGQGVRIQFGNLSLSSACVGVNDPFTAVKGLEFDWTDSGGTGRPAETQKNIEGVTFSDCIIRSAGTGVVFQSTQSNTSDTQSFPVQVSNCVLDGSSADGFRLWNYGASDKAWTVTNCTIRCSGRAFDIFSSTNNSTYTITNNLILSAAEDLRDQGGGGTNTVLGSNNFGPQTSATHVFPDAIKGSPYPITATTSFSTPLGSGDYAVYMGATGALANVTGNDVWQQGVGPGTNSDVPTTDINGVARSGASCNPGAFEADGFVAPTITTQTIGPVGRDYATFILAEASLPAEDITFTNRAFVFEADAATYNEIITFQSSLTTDATRQVTYKPATGSEHGGDKDAGVIIDGASTTPVNLRDSYMALRGLNIKSQVTAVYLALPTTGRVLEGLIIGPSTTTGGYTQVREGADQTVFRNCVFRDTGAWGVNFNPATVNGSNSCAFLNCTFFASTSAIIDQPSVAASVTLLNNLFLTGSIAYSEHANTTSTGSNNYAAGALSPVALQGSPYPITPTTSFSTPLGAGDFAVYMGSNGSLANVTGNDVWQQGVGPGTNSDVPTTDINGVARSGATCNPGAFEADGFVAPTVTTQTIGPVGRDFATFTLAEASLPAEDITFTNRAFVFEADAGTYSESVIIDHALTCDPTRNVTFQSATFDIAHIETDASFGVLQIRDGVFTTLRRLQITNTNTGAACRGVEIIPASGDSCEGCTLDGLTVTGANSANFTAFEVELNTGAAAGGAGSAAHPSVLQNCVALGTGSGIGIAGGATGEIHARIVNCTLAGTGLAAISIQTPSDVTVEVVNTINLSHAQTFRTLFTTGALTTSGSNNFGNTTQPFPDAIKGSPYPITATTSFSTPLGSGDYAVYMGATGALADKPGNDVWQQGVGPGSNGDVPTTDINGVARSGASCNPGAFEADGFVAPTVTTQTIGPVGRDYATFTLAEASLPSEDITFTNRAFVFEADAATYSENVYFGSTLTTDATRNVTYKPAAGSEHGGVVGAGVVINSASINFFRDSFMLFEGIEVNGSSTQTLNIDACTGTVTRRCIINATTQGFVIGNTVLAVEVSNCVISSNNYSFLLQCSTGAQAVTLYNNTILDGPSGLVAIRVLQSGTATISLDAVNNLMLNGAGVYLASGTVTVTGSNNFGGSTSPWPAAIQGSPYPVTASTAYDPGAGDFALYVGKNGALLDSPNNDVINGGVGPASNSDVPTTDILGDTRSGTTTNPGAFALAQATAVLTRTIGPVGRDYATFTAAEADVENIGGSADLVFENERIEFLADAGTYTTILNPNSGLTTDATRNVTYKPAVGSEHGGVVGAGVVIDTGASNSPVFVDDDFTVIDGLNLATTTMYCAWILGSGIVMRNCIATAFNRGFLIYGGQSSAPNILENCVSRGGPSFAFLVLGGGPVSADAHARIVNCTGSSTGNDAFRNQATVSGTSATAEYINCLSLSSPTYQTIGSFATATGSNNFGGSYNPFPAALQGSPYPITPTTNTTPGFGDYAIYEAATGALIVVDDNAALGGGVGPAANADVPVFDINGVKRIGGGCDPGAFEGVRSRSTDVWDVMYGSHNIPGTFGKLVQDIPEAVPSAEEIATAVWNKLIADHQGAGSFGELSQQTKLAADRAGTQRLQ
jgi:hypothetical protein